MPVAIKLAESLPVDGLMSDLAGLDQRWTPVLRGEIEGWGGVALRSHDGRTETLGYESRPCLDTPLMDTLPSARRFLSFFRCEFQRVRLLALGAGCVIKRHSDNLP